MPTLYLLRHAKSSWEDGSLSDHDRPLAPRGRKACLRLRRHCRTARIEPEVILCSTALRARATLAAVLPDRVASTFEPALYHASGATLAARIRSLSGASAMIVGHNPALRDLILELAQPSPLRELVEAKLPTGALVTIELTSWDAPHGALIDVVVPRDL